MTQAERSRVFVSATPPPSEITSENTLRQSPKGTQTPFSITPTWSLSFPLRGGGKKVGLHRIRLFQLIQCQKVLFVLIPLVPVQAQARNFGSSWESQVPPLKARASTKINTDHMPLAK